MTRKIYNPVLALLFFMLIGGNLAVAQNSLFFVYLSSNPDREELPEGDVSALQEGHLENIDRLYKAGDLLLAGPFDGGGGVFVLTAVSPEGAKDLLASDPAISADRFIVDILPIEVDKGWICEQVKPYEMISLNFIRITPGDSEPIPHVEYNRYLENEDVLYAVSMNVDTPGAEYVVILEASADADAFARKHPLVKDGNYTYGVKKWWTTDQTFCSDMNKKLH